MFSGLESLLFLPIKGLVELSSILIFFILILYSIT